jgi:riboflavin synthase
MGESVAVNGVCLTAVAFSDSTVAFDLLEQTLKITNLGELAAGREVNLERAMRADTRFSGHFVQGHVDGTAEILVLEPAGQDHRLTISLPAELARYLIPKGSITVDGMSLTIAELEKDNFTIWITPHTYAVTTLRNAKAGQQVNIEVDMMAKYLDQMLERRLAAREP